MNRGFGEGAKRTKKIDASPRCELCDDNSIPDKVRLSGRCHLTAPLQATVEGNILTLSCYIPKCRREIGRFIVERINQ